MPWVETAAAILATANLGKELHEGAGRWRLVLTRLANRVKHGPFLIPVLGAGGTGKSTLGLLLHNPADAGFAGSAPYEESLTTEILKLKGEFPGSVVVAPGQERRIDMEWPEVADSVSNGNTHLVINVVSYGFHSFGLHSYREHELYQPGMTSQVFLEAYTRDARAKELALLERLLKLIPRLQTKLHFLTVITKQDLWWPVRQDVRQHYEHGAYAAMIDELMKRFGTASVQHDIIPVSLTLQNFSDMSGEVLAQTSPGYDLNLHLAYLTTLISRMSALAEVER